jgi:MoxR-like ATPase
MSQSPFATYAAASLAPNLPMPPAARQLVGSSELIKDLVALVRARTPVGLHGLPGVGKTALALAVARDPLIAADFAVGCA